MNNEIIEFTNPLNEPIAVVRNKVVAIEGVHVVDREGRSPRPYIKSISPCCLIFLIGTPTPLAVNESYDDVKKKIFGEDAASQ